MRRISIKRERKGRKRKRFVDRDFKRDATAARNVTAAAAHYIKVPFRRFISHFVKHHFILKLNIELGRLASSLFTNFSPSQSSEGPTSERANGKEVRKVDLDRAL